MDVNNISYDKTHAEIQLKARKLAILELMEQFEELELNVCPAALGAMFNDIDKIDELLGV